MDDKSYQLICSYHKQKYFISTAYRRASTPEPLYYFETMVWEWDNKTKERGKILEQQDSGVIETMALENHFKIIQELNTLNNG